jgi:hypothetical protein
VAGIPAGLVATAVEPVLVVGEPVPGCDEVVGLPVAELVEPAAAEELVG